MKASEVLNRYTAGERNFQRVNLRGEFFKGQNLSGADFSEADLRSTNFTGANLRDANFTGAKFGLQRRWAAFLTILTWLLASISGFLSMFAGAFVSLIFFDSSSLQNQIAGWVSLLVIITFLIVTIRQGAVVAVVAVVAATAAGAAVVAGTGAGVAGAAAIGVIAGTGAGAAVVAVAVAAAGAVAVAGAAGAVAVGVIAVVVVAAVIAAVVAVAGAVAGAGAYVGWRAMRGDARDAWVRSFAIAFAAIGGTSFRDADLSHASFTGAKLKSTDFRKATLTRVRWYGAKMLDRVRPGDTYLANTQVRQWLLGQETDKNFDGQKLQGINLQGAILTDASFIDANLSEANLQDADLSRAKLVQTQLDRTDLTGATLTGAFIEDWGITIHTKLDDVKCEYVYMRLPTKENPEPRRKPDNRSEVFEGDDFADFIKPIFDTLDLYHNQEVNPRAIAISWKQLAENNPDAELQFASMEVKGEDNLLLRLKTAPNADLSKLSAEYFETYNQLKALATDKSKKLIAEKDDRIQQLENMVNTALKRPGFYAQNYNHQGDNEMAGDRNIQMGNGNYNERIEGNYVQGNYYALEQKQTLAEAAAEIQQLLTQLQSQGFSPKEAQQQVANNLATKAKDNPTTLGKLVKWGQSLGDTAAQTTVSEAAKEVVKLALRLSGVSLP